VVEAGGVEPPSGNAPARTYYKLSLVI